MLLPHYRAFLRFRRGVSRLRCSTSKGLAAAAVALAALAETASAHDFWIEATRVEADATELALRIGHTGEGELWTILPYRVSLLQSFTPDQRGGVHVRSHLAAMETAAGTGTLRLDLDSATSHMVALQTTHVTSVLPAEKFNAYLAEEGLQEVIQIREARGQSEVAGTEIYSRRAKVLLGPPGDAFPFAEPVGQTVEVVPLSDPRREGHVGFRVLHNDAPVRGARVAISSLDTGLDDVMSRATDARGEVTLPLRRGHWMVHTVWSTPLPDTHEMDWNTVFASLSFRTQGDAPAR